MKNILKFALFLMPFLIQAQGLIPYSKPLPSISKDGMVKMPDGSLVKIENFKDKESVVIFMVRHAEKDTMGGANADLNAEGRGRAMALVSILKKMKIQKFYSTDVPRTKNTAKPLADLKHKKVEIYDPKKHKELFESILNTQKGKRVLVVGHSNTVPKMLNILRGSEEEKDIPDNEYSRLYIISVKKVGEAKVTLINF
jgi:2,3-bisphosphoglycerate-dependent phosphoglycerate mutase